MPTKAMSILRDGRVKSISVTEISENKYRIEKKGLSTFEINEVDFNGKVSIKKNGSFICKEFIEE